MKTTKPMTFITYNSEAYLRNVLTELNEAGIIDLWYYMPHKGEYGGKDHIHCMIYPNKPVDTLTLKKRFNEPDPQNPTKPLGIGDRINPTNDTDSWLAYQVHDEEYQTITDPDGKPKQYRYKPEDIRSNDPDAPERIKEALEEKLKGFYPLKALNKMILSGTPLYKLVKEGHVNPRDVRSLKDVLSVLEPDDDSRLMEKLDRLRNENEALRNERDDWREMALPPEWRPHE